MVSPTKLKFICINASNAIHCECELKSHSNNKFFSVFLKFVFVRFKKTTASDEWYDDGQAKALAIIMEEKVGSFVVATKNIFNFLGRRRKIITRRKLCH